MKNRYLLVPAIGLFASAPVMAQDSTVSDAVEGTRTQSPISPPSSVEIPPPAPPAPPAPPPPQGAPVPSSSNLPQIEVATPYPLDPRIVNFAKARPVQSDYPASSWKNGEEGRVRYSIDVDAEGNATKCTITVSSGFAALDAKTCEVVMERGEFRPALEDTNKPIAGTLTKSFSWRKREPDFPQMKMKVEYLIDEEGSMSGCKVLTLEGDLPRSLLRQFERNAELGNPCPFPARQMGVPYRDENGVPVSKKVTFNFDIVLEDPPE